MSASFPLRSLLVSIVDIQSTGAAISGAHPIEIGWLAVRGCDELDPARVEARLVALPEGATLPTRVARITGIDGTMLAGAAPAETVARELRDGLATNSPVVLVAHYARFESPFLRSLLPGGFDFELLCTHEIARRLFPDLPRRTLRALAGFLGHATPELRRTADHVLATAAIWRELVTRLDRDAGVRTFADLRRWLAGPPVPASGRREFRYPFERQRRLALPDSPGIYRFRGARGELLYVGKASSLRSRVNSYFRTRRSHAEKTLELLTRAVDVETTSCATPLEAALLEAEEIRRARPPYNIALRPPREGDAIRYWTNDLSSSAPAADARHREGPVPESLDLSSIPRLALRFTGGANGCEPGPILLLPADRAPDETTFTAGLALFGASNGLASGSVPTVDRLLLLGGAVWKREIERRDAEARRELESDEEPGGEEPEKAEEWSWTAERVVAALEWHLAHAARWLRRGRWLSRLADSTIVFRDGGDAEPRRLELHSGVIAESGAATAIDSRSARSETSRDAPPGSLDASAAARLSVLTGELKRLVRDGSEVEVLLSRRIRLDSKGLAKLLRWF